MLTSSSRRNDPTFKARAAYYAQTVFGKPLSPATLGENYDLCRRVLKLSQLIQDVKYFNEVNYRTAPTVAKAHGVTCQEFQELLPHIDAMLYDSMIERIKAPDIALPDSPHINKLISLSETELRTTSELLKFEPIRVKSGERLPEDVRRQARVLLDASMNAEADFNRETITTYYALSKRKQVKGYWAVSVLFADFYGRETHKQARTARRENWRMFQPIFDECFPAIRTKNPGK